jgi:prevent-host-death family protein
MTEVRSTDFQSHLGRYQDMALAGHPVTITKHSRKLLVLLSYEEYEALTKKTKRALHPSQLSRQDIEAISTAKVSDEYAHLDDLLKE